MNDIDIIILEQYVDNLPEPKNPYQKYEFDQASYSKWASNEILNRAISCTEVLPSHITGVYTPDVFEVIEEFAFDMQCCMENQKDWKQQKIFSIAIDTANDMMRYYIKNKKRKERA